MDNKPVFIHTIYIASTAEKVWQALTDSKVTPSYWFGATFESDLQEGSGFVLKEGDKETDYGTVLESKPPHKLVLNWTNKEPGIGKDMTVTYKITPLDSNVRLTVFQEGIASHAPDVYDEEERTPDSFQEGWPYVLSNLKSYLELGTEV